MMQRSDATERQEYGAREAEAAGVDLELVEEAAIPLEESEVHLLDRKHNIICDTEARGHATPGGRSRAEIALDASLGFIPLWARNTILRWRFQERSMANFRNPGAAKAAIRGLLAEALLAWGNAAPVKFTEDADLWDFEIVMMPTDKCRPGGGCVLASAFFPDSGRHELLLYPMMFTQSRKEQVDTFIHEIGHVFGLRHFFANVSETAFPVEIFGKHDKFTIMNYGEMSELTPRDRNDLARLYQMAWSGSLTHVNGTPIRLVQPFSALAPAPGSLVAVAQVQPVEQPLAAAYPEALELGGGEQVRMMHARLPAG
jgi:hypothetical protein